MKYASFGSVSQATLRIEDLLESFADELEYQVQRNADWYNRDRYMALVKEARKVDPEDETAGKIVNELIDSLQEFAPPYSYFGANEDDGADFGFWLADDAIDAAFDGLKVEDTSEVPEDYSGEVLHVNDHGNLTLYTAANGKLTEVWAIV